LLLLGVLSFIPLMLKKEKIKDWLITYLFWKIIGVFK